MKRKKIIIFTVCFLATYLSFFIFSQFFILKLNYSESLPHHLFLVKKHTLPVQRGQLFAFRLRHDRYYNSSDFIKIVGGITDDKVTIKDRKFYINNQFIGVAKHSSLRGDVLPINNFSGTIPKNKFFAYSPHKDSYDSRYQAIGLIDAKDVIGTAIAIF